MTIRADARSLHARPWEKEIQTCIHGGGSTSGFQALGGERRAIFFFYEIAGRSPGEPVGKIEDAPILNPRWEMQGGRQRSSLRVSENAGGRLVESGVRGCGAKAGTRVHWKKWNGVPTGGNQS